MELWISFVKLIIIIDVKYEVNYALTPIGTSVIFIFFYEQARKIFRKKRLEQK